MLILLNLTDSTFQLVPSSAQLQSTPNEAMLVRLVRTTAAATSVEQLLEGGTLELLVLPKGQREGDNLIILGEVTRNTEAGAYQLPINALTDKVVELLKIGDGDPATDVASVLVEAWIRYTPATGSPVTSQAIPLTLVSAPNFEGAAPTAIPSADSMYLRYDAGGQTLSSDDKTRVQARIGLGTAATHAHSDYATAAQGAKADTAVQPADLTSGLAGKADLVGGKVPSSQLPSYVDDVVEAANYAALPGTGETGKLYITLSDNKVFRWSGSAYVEITSGLDIASQAEAEAGTDNTKAMTPLRTAEAIAALGGGGSGLIRSYGGIQGYTDVGSPPSGPPNLIINVSNNGYITVVIDGTSTTFALDTSAPYDGSIYIDVSSLFTLEDRGNAFVPALSSLTPFGVGDYVASYNGGGDVLIAAASATGASRSLSATATTNVVTGGGSGVDEVLPSGESAAADVIGGAPGKVLKPVAIGWACTSMIAGTVGISYHVDGTDYDLFNFDTSSLTGAQGQLTPDIANIGNWLSSPPGASLRLRIAGDVPVGGDFTIWAIAEQV